MALTKEERKQKLVAISEIISKIRASGQNLIQIQGAFGETGIRFKNERKELSSNTGFVEKIGPSLKGNTVVKFFGCSQPWKGLPSDRILVLLSVAKRFVDVSIREILKNDWLLILFIVLNFLFRKKKIIHYVRVIFTEIDSVVVRNIKLKEDNMYAPSVQAFRTALRESIRRTWDVEFNSALVYNEQTDYEGKRELWIAIACGGEFTAHCLENDNAYRGRFQDVVSLMDKDSFKKNPIKELNRLWDILIARENSDRMKDKWKNIRRLTNIALKNNKELMKFVMNFFISLDMALIKMDEADKYFSADRDSYDYEGKNHKERVMWMREIDERDGNVRFIMTENQVPQPPHVPAINEQVSVSSPITTSHP